MQEEKWRITPKGIALLALIQTGLLDDSDDPRFDGFWTIFEAVMERHGYITKE